MEMLLMQALISAETSARTMQMVFKTQLLLQCLAISAEANLTKRNATNARLISDLETEQGITEKANSIQLETSSRTTADATASK
jgi:hypothetical protein